MGRGDIYVEKISKDFGEKNVIHSFIGYYTISSTTSVIHVHTTNSGYVYTTSKKKNKIPHRISMHGVFV